MFAGDLRRFLLIWWQGQLVFGAFCFGLSVWLAWHNNKAEFASRSGAILSLMGGFLTFRKYIRGADHAFLRDTGRADRVPFQHPLNQPEAKMRAQEADGKAMFYGILYIICGTIIWGYGDWVLVWFGVCNQ